MSFDSYISFFTFFYIHRTIFENRINFIFYQLAILCQFGIWNLEFGKS
jgi:hypothetical protein